MDAPTPPAVPLQRPARRIAPDAPDGSADTAGTDSRLALLAAEALSLVVRSCSTGPARQVLRRISHADPHLLEAAAVRCRQVDQLDARVRQAAARLLRDTAAELQDAHRR